MIADNVKFCPRCGTALESRPRMGHLRPVCPSCGWIFFPDPKVAAAVLVIRAGKVLFTRRANSPQRGLWSFPGGFVDAGEDPARAAERECLEETGLQVRVTNLLDVIAGQAHPRGAHIVIVYQAEITAGELHPGDDADRANFFSPDKFPPLAFESTRKILVGMK